jgi:hypothetical protein
MTRTTFNRHRPHKPMRTNTNEKCTECGRDLHSHGIIWLEWNHVVAKWFGPDLIELEKDSDGLHPFDKTCAIRVMRRDHLNPHDRRDNLQAAFNSAVEITAEFLSDKESA